MRSGEIVAGGEGDFQFGASANGEHVLERARCRGVQASERQRRERGRTRRGGRAMPVEMIKHVVDAARAAAPHVRDADRAEAIDKHARLAAFVVQGDAAFHELIIALEDAPAHAHRRARRAQKKDAPETHRQLQARAAIFDRPPTCGEHLERAIEQDRMQRVLAGARRDGIGK